MTSRTSLLLLVLFVGSGCSALIYEIVWFQVLQLSIGSTAVSLGVLLGTFMGGMCLGSIGFSRVVSWQRHPLRVYAWLEIGIGFLGLILLFVLPWIADIYVFVAPSGMGSLALRSAICAICLLPPTVLMGATLPAIARWIESSGQNVSQLGFFYGANIAGAVVGCLAAGFYLLRVYDVTVATYVAISVNFGIAAIALGMARTMEHSGSPQPRGDLASCVRTEHRAVYIAIACSGMAALGSEVTWTRLLSLTLGASVYTFAIILAAFLVGLGLGSSLVSIVRLNRTNAWTALGVCQLLLVPASAWTAYCLTESLPYWPIDMALSSPWYVFQLDLVRCFWAMSPAACLWGASFPLAVQAIPRASDLSRVVGYVYAANTVGAIAGSLLFSVLFIRWIGTQNSQRLLILLSAAAGAMLLLPSLWRRLRKSSSSAVSGLVAFIVVTFVVAWLTLRVSEVPPGLIGFGRKLPNRTLPSFVFVGEGMNASVAVSVSRDGVRNFHVSGKIVASSGKADMRNQRMLCHLPALFHGKCESVLIVGCGAGVTAGSFVNYPGVKRIVICEIEPLIPRTAGEYFAAHNHDVMNDPRVEVVVDDARHFVATTKEKFDIITSDPIHPWVKGAAALYTLEYFELCRKRLRAGGIVTQWVPLYESTMASVKSQIATFVASFPVTSVWSNRVAEAGHDVILLGCDQLRAIDVNELDKRLARADHSRILRSLEESRLGSATKLLITFAGRGVHLRDWLADAQINHDRNMRLQYVAGLGLNTYQADTILQDMLRHQRFPAELIVGTGPKYNRLQRLLSGRRRATPPK